MIETNQVTVIQGATGCGKTTQVPQFILDSCVDHGVHCNMIITQPRRIAAISVTKRVSEERSWPVGTLVGYQVGLNNKTSSDTRLTFCTTGVLLQKFINKKKSFITKRLLSAGNKG
jgi:ATP-dependent RNA helicase TDRD9